MGATKSIRLAESGLGLDRSTYRRARLQPYSAFPVSEGPYLEYIMAISGFVATCKNGCIQRDMKMALVGLHNMGNQGTFVIAVYQHGMVRAQIIVISSAR